MAVKSMLASKNASQPRLRYKLSFYIGGSIFAVATYLAGTWLYRLEAESWKNAHLKLTFKDVISGIYPVHLFTFVAWFVGCLSLAILLGYLFDREVRFRQAAENKANIDGLTHLYNHRYFQERFHAEIERARRYQRPLSLIILDIDDFKSFNDRYGHQEGDRLLAWFGNILNGATREIDICARYGGEEFAIILPETDLQEASAVAERIVSTVSSSSSPRFPRQVTVSAGIADFPEHGQTRHAMILSADVALYYAKLSGKNRACIYDKAMTKVYRTTPERLQSLLTEEDLGAIEALSAAVDAKDQCTHHHSETVSKLAIQLGQKMNLPSNELENLRAAALLHDIGKLGMPDKILKKKGPLQLDEWRYVENHPKIGSQILEKVQQLSSVVPTVRHHHERFDGHGYPAGLSGKDIPLLARIVAVADAYDAMVSDRNYRKALTPEQALEEIVRCSGTQFDPEIVEVFVNLMREQLGKQTDSEISEERKAA